MSLFLFINSNQASKDPILYWVECVKSKNWFILFYIRKIFNTFWELVNHCFGKPSYSIEYFICSKSFHEILLECRVLLSSCNMIICILIWFNFDSMIKIYKTLIAIWVPYYSSGLNSRKHCYIYNCVRSSLTFKPISVRWTYSIQCAWLCVAQDTYKTFVEKLLY